jgi:hypothetical protein
MASRPINVSLTGVSDKTIPVNRYDEKMTVQIAVTGTATWTLKWTLANVMRGDTPAWADHPGGALTGSAAGQAQFTFPVTALQLAITDGAGTVTAIIVQSD